MLELRVKVININLPVHHPVLEQCRPLYEYSWFIDQIRTFQQKGLSRDAALIEAMENCRKKDILTEFLKDKSNVINIYVCADKEDRIKRIMKLFSLTREAAEVMLEETDKQRAEYYYKNTGKTWGDVNNYHMILNTSDLGIENCADILMRYFEMKDYI